MNSNSSIETPILETFLHTLFDIETNSLRFELVCIGLYREAEGIELVPTSRSWDRGRDGRPITLTQRIPAQQPILCASLSASLDNKVESDIRRNIETTATQALVFCTTKSLSEQACDKIEVQIRALDPHLVTVRVLGRIQLVAMGERFQHVIRKHYAAELANLKSALIDGSKPDAEPDKIGLRLALITQTGDDANALRFDLAKRLLLEALQANGPTTPGNLATKVSGRLHLPRSLSGTYVTEVLERIISEDLVSVKGDTYDLTATAHEFLTNVPTDASQRLLEGRKAVREAIKQLSGHTLSEEQYKQVWNVIQDGLSQLFYEHGAAIVQMISGVLSGDGARSEHSLYKIIIERLGDKILPLFSSPEQGEEVRQAIIDMFSETSLEAFQWLTQICSVYIMMCSLGFETLSAQQVSNVMKNLWLIPDSDVIISLLCVGESNHEQIKRIIEVWRKLGGKFLAASPILEEVAYHAWISEPDYSGVQEFLEKLSEEQIKHVAGNSFVRSFKRVAQGLTSRKYWQKYIGEYKGQSSYDYGNILEILRGEFGFQILSPADEPYDAFVKQVKDFLIMRACKDVGCESKDLKHKIKDKCRRDALLLGAVKAQRDHAVSGLSGRAVIMSSAHLMKEADEVFRSQFGRPDAVVTISAVGCLLTLLPGVHMGLGTLRGVLFDSSLASSLSPIQRYAYRIIEGAGEHHVPWSRRVTLVRELGDRMLSDAIAYGQPVRKIREKVLQSENPEYSAKIVSDALQRMAVTTKTEQEIIQLRQELQRLSDELAKKDLELKNRTGKE
jgi:hypothetical protein